MGGQQCTGMYSDEKGKKIIKEKNQCRGKQKKYGTKNMVMIVNMNRSMQTETEHKERLSEGVYESKLLPQSCSS